MNSPLGVHTYQGMTPAAVNGSFAKLTNACVKFSCEYAASFVDI